MINGKTYNFKKVVITFNEMPISTTSDIIIPEYSQEEINNIRACVPSGIFELIKEPEESLLQYNITLYNKGKFETHKL